ncbi:efflux RND transporter permease subunit [Formosa sp. PL04]|uniref:efflux RND transporter permease subunit n=1 Tax=Formosa sp. PL04 TaxID=3081755 RepID=UPI002981FD96|nr:efflux RND transporter permease subunit [Formosa sp. PL04]MDW5289641.1 efflux RND transporter permease subunit [Formosa sp. PL04]
MAFNSNKISEKIVSLRWATIVFVVLSTLFFGYQLSKLTIDADIIKSLPDDDKHAKLLKHISKNFGGNNMGVIILETDNIYQTDVLEHVRTLTDTLEKIEGIASVSSLTNIINIKGSDYGIEVGQLVDESELPTTPEAFKTLRNNILSNDMYKGTIVSDDETSTLIIFNLEDEAIVNVVAQNVLKKTEALHLPETLYYTGSPMLVTYISELMKSDLTKLLPLAFLVIALILFLSFRTISGVVLPLLTAVISIIWSLGLMGLLGYSMSMISNNIPIILLAIGSAYAIHVINRINQLRAENRPNTVQTALAYVLVPVILAATTTVIGFVSFIFGAYLEMIVDFGVFTALGTLFACLLSIFFVPAIMSFNKSKKVTSEILNPKTSFLTKHFLEPLNSVLFKYPKRILLIWILLIAISVVGLFSIERSVDIQEYFKKDNPTRLAEKIMVDKFGGTKPVFVLFKGDMQNPEVLKTMQKTAKYMEQSPDIYTSMSIVNLISELNFAITGQRDVPEDPEQIAQLWFFLDGNEVLERFVSEDLDEGIIISKFKSPDNQSKKVFADYMNTFIEENSTDDCQIEITGMPFVDITMDQSLINSQMGSISIAIIFVIFIVGLILRSFKSGLYATIPIIAAIIILFGVMGLSGISLNIATVLVASVALGIGIDYSIHIISHFNHVLKDTQNFKTAIQQSIIISGNAIIINVVAVSAGFLMLVFSDMVPLQYFGLLIAISMVSSGLGAITLLPAILILVNNKKH